MDAASVPRRAGLPLSTFNGEGSYLTMPEFSYLATIPEFYALPEAGVGTRTLQRRLTSEGTTWLEVLNATRERLAVHYLKRTRMSAAEVSFLLGFEDPNSFFRAFQRWTGTTPEAWRASARAGDAPGLAPLH